MQPRGFTLVELIIVVLVLAVLAGMATPLMAGSLDRSRISSIGLEVATAVRYARDTAMGTAQPCRVTFDTAAETVQVECLTFKRIADLNDSGQTEIDEDWVESPSEVEYQAVTHPEDRDADYTIDYTSGTRFGGVDVVSATFGVDNFVTFDFSGQPTSAGQTVITYGAHQITIAVEAATGKVTVQS
jgi:prepilin-type N-terminal cleavage/methylation domain-containing protein